MITKLKTNNIQLNLKKQIYFVIPAYNEGKVIINVIKDLEKENFDKLIIIDDGSTDNTYKTLKNYKTKNNSNLILLKHIINRGQGASLKTGIDFALQQKDCKYIVTFDSDGQHRISDLHKFISVLETGKYDIVLGSRFLNKQTKKLVPIKKQILLKGSLWITMILSNIKLTDTHNGYRVMNKNAAKQINITLDQFEHASEILDEISKKKIKYKEVPVFIDYTNYSKGKGQKITNSIRILLKMILKMR